MAIALDTLSTPELASLVAPVDDPCLSKWQRSTRACQLLNVNKTVPVRNKSEYVVLGSGLSGALTVFNLLENGAKGSDVVILEARELAGGATSRNAGHIRPGEFGLSLRINLRIRANSSLRSLTKLYKTGYNPWGGTSCQDY